MYFTSSDIQKRRELLQSKWNQLFDAGEVVVVYAGEPIQKPGGLDQTYPFLPHPAYFWLTGRRRENEAVLYNKESGWIEFQQEIGPDEAVWEGERTDLLVNEKGRSNKELESFLKKFTKVYSLGQTSQSVTGKAFELRTLLDQTRRKKDEAEVKLFRHLAAIAKHGYEKIGEILKPGITEKEIKIAFESEIMKQGAHGVPYETIVGAGPNSAILHALPTERKVQKEELVLIDAGADMYDYCVDITRMFPSDTMSSQHKSLYQLVLQAHTECIALSKPGVLWGDVHLRAARIMTEGLLQLGILRGSVDELMDKGTIAVFFPHGVGHLVGLRVRDTGHEERKEAKIYAGARVRVEIELEAGHFITVEPGCYFIDALLNSQAVRNQHRELINWSEVEKWKGIGGVRIEDNILITENGNDNLTMIVPKTITDFKI